MKKIVETVLQVGDALAEFVDFVLVAIADRLGAAARDYAETHLARDAIMGRFETTALALCGRPAPAPKEAA